MFEGLFEDKERMVQDLNTLRKKHRMSGVGPLKYGISIFVTWPPNIGKRRIRRRPLKVSSVFNQSSETLHKSLGFVRRRARSVRLRKDEGWGATKFLMLSGATAYLPEGLVEEILSRLPVKPLIRFRCACKLWRSLICRERFIALHRKNYKTINVLVGNCDIFGTDLTISSFLPPSQASLQKVADFRVPLSLIRPQPLTYRTYPLVAGACNGLICLYSYDADNIVFWNPTLKEYKIIPKSSIPRRYQHGYCTVGFGFDPQKDDYKILQMVYHYPRPRVLQLELYSLRKNLWRKVDSHAFAASSNSITTAGLCSLPFTENRVICALVNPVNEPRRPQIISFDMSSETVEIVQVSLSLDAELYTGKYYSLFPFKDSIALGICYILSEQQGCCDVFVLDDFYSSKRSWSKLLSIKHRSLPRPIGCWESRFLFQESPSGKLMLYDHGIGGDHPIMVDLGIAWDSQHVTTALYKESLVRISQIIKPEAV